ncbi:MAG: GNAT family N-acetyltransferase [Betaproteobacteria bacterium]
MSQSSLSAAHDTMMNEFAATPDKYVTALDAAKSIKPGSKVFVGTACATPRALVHALESMDHPPADLELFHFLTTGMVPVVDGVPCSRFRHRCFFVGSDMTELVNTGRAEYVPLSLTQIPPLIQNGRIRADVALVQVSPPDRQGYVSLGVSVDITMAIVRQARRIIAEVNPHMPRTAGDSFLHVDMIEKFVAVDTPLIEYQHEPASEIASSIARYVAEIIEDGSTLQIGLGRIPNETLKFLKNRLDLGIHSDVITDSILDLIDHGVITGRKKTQHPGKIVTSFCMGSRQLYDMVDGNPLFQFRPIEFVANVEAIARNKRMVSLTQAFAIDLTGQVCTDQFQGRFYSGISCQPEFMRGAAMSEGGKPIVCLSSTTEDGKESRIRPTLQAGEGVTIARADVHYVVTEYGIAYLYGKSISERAVALIEVAHPDFRPQLLEEAKRLHFVRAEQKVASSKAYLVEEERHVTLKEGKVVLLRPAGAHDVMAMKEIFYRMSAEDVYTRFFQRLDGLTFAAAQRLCNVNFDTEVAFMATVGTRENEEIIGSACYFLNASTNLAEVAYMIVPEWQATGLGRAMQQRLMEYAKQKGVRGFLAEVLQGNKKMISLAKKACDNVQVSKESGVLEIVMIFD